MSERVYLYLTGTLFGIGGIVHIVRLFERFPIHVASFSLPVWVSWIGGAIGIGMCVWAYRLGVRVSRHAHSHI